MMIRSILAAGAAVVALIGFNMADAHAQVSVISPGSAISSNLLPCTVGASGHDAAGNAVALTAGHCMMVAGSDVYAGGRHVGKFANWPADWKPFGTTIGHDWAVIQLDSDVLIGWGTPDGAQITDIAAPPASGPLDKYGRTTRTTHGTVTGLDGNTISATNLGLWGDSGGPAYVGTSLVGITDAINTSAGGTLYSGVLSDIDARGGVGVGFHLG